MKKSIFTLFVLLVSNWCWGQVVTTNPAFVTQNGGVINLIFDATLGNAGLKNYTGTDVYAYTGVITTTSNGSWVHTPLTWLDNSAKYKMTSMGNNKWALSITPSVTSYYGLVANESVMKLAFVFRNSTGTVSGRDVGGADIFVPVYQSGLNVAFNTPATNLSVTAGTAINLQVSSSLASNLNLLVNGSSVATATGSTTLNYTYTFSSAIDYTLIAQSTVGTTTVTDTVYVCVPAPVTNMARPAGVKDGINYIDNSTATLVMYAPGKTNAFLIGEFNNWIQKNAYQMYKDGDYWWYTLTGLIPGKVYGFQYLVDGNLKVTDPYTEMVLDPWNDQYINSTATIYPDLKPYPVGKTTGLVATLQTAKPAYTWEIPTFTLPPARNMVIYELLLRDFTPEKTLNAAITKLDYLKNLGVTAIELMPITEFDGNDSWGYNPNHYFAPDKAYGDENAYKKFIDECHKRGMAVFLDMVFNQASGLCPFAMLYWDSVNNRPAANNPWMNPVAPHPYSVLNDFNHSFTGTKEYFKRVLQFWLTEYKVDGYRMDLTKGFTQTASTEGTASNYDQSRIDNLSTYYDAAKAVKSDVMFILEHFCNNDEETVLANKGIYLWRNLNNAYSQAAMGYQSNSDFSGMFTTPYNWVGYAESHDEERNFYNVKINGAGTLKTDSVARINRVPLVIAFNTLLPGPKMIWEFGEMGYDYSINSLGGRTNDKPSAFGWLNLANRKAASDAAAKIINLRSLYPAAFTQGIFTLNIGTSDWSGRRIALAHTDLNMVVLGNFDASLSINSIPYFPKTGTWYNLLTGEQLNVTNTSMSIPLQPGEVEIYTDRIINLPNGITTPTAQNSISVFPSVTSGFVYITSPVTVQNVHIYNLQGSLVKSITNSTSIDVENLTSGIYIMEVNTVQGKSIHKIIKQ
ncbi:MAG: alpha-amylase family glycosyl hydrolase [Bacteroidota bacterium]|nr:alpha-amylase family glycosyl hydrolase [Bacteroidota bacterium]